MKNITAKLKESRKKSGLSQRAAASWFEVSLYTYQRWEQGLGLPNMKNYLKVVEFISD